MVVFNSWRRRARVGSVAAVSALGWLICPVWAATPQSELARWEQAAGQAGDAVKGRVFISQRHGGEWSCASCHGTPPNKDTQHASTGKKIAPLAPAFNAQRFTDSAKVNKWFKRNCKDVLSRECTAVEKADVLAYLNGVS